MFPDNMRRAMVYAGRIMIDLIPKIYDTNRILRIRGSNNQEELVEINKVIGQDKDGNPIMMNDLNMGKFDIEANIGLYTTQKEETLQKLIEVLQFTPDAAPLIAPTIIRNMDIDDGEQLAQQLEGTTQQVVANPQAGSPGQIQ